MVHVVVPVLELNQPNLLCLTPTARLCLLAGPKQALARSFISEAGVATRS